MSKITDEFAKLKNRFIYKTDHTQYGRREYWKVLNKSGKVEGDCEDFSLTLATAVYGCIFKAYLKGARLVWCEFYGQGHIYLETEEGCFDNIQPGSFNAKATKGYTKHKDYNLFTVYCKILYSKFLGLLN